jgi:putative addiction module killer protein
MEAIPREIKNYLTKEGREPFAEWLIHLKDTGAKVAIVKRLERVQLGNLGDCKPVGEGVLELKFHIGHGYRIYFGQDGKVFVVLLCGGEKHGQKEDIKLAKKYWSDYKLRMQEGESHHGG